MNKIMKQSLSCDRETALSINSDYELLKSCVYVVDKLIAERKKKNMTQEDIAKIMNVSTIYVSSLEKYLCDVSLDDIIKYAEACGSKIKIELI